MGPTRIQLNRSIFILFCTMIAVAGCGNDLANPPLPGVEPEVINGTDTFEFQVTSVKNYTGTWSYDWTTTGTVVNVDQSAAVTSGTVTLTLLDGAGATVFEGDLSQGGSFTTDAGVTGQWRIIVTLVKGSGTLNFRTEKNL